MGDISVVPAQVSDAPEMADLHAVAFKDDAFSNFMLMGRPSDAHHRLMTDAISSWFNDPAAEVAKAVNGSGKMVGWTCWITKDTQTDSTGDGEKQPGSATQEPPQETVGANNADSSKEEKTPQQIVGGLKNTDTAQQEKKHMKGDKHIILQGMATHPDYQRRGIGSKLARWGTEKADERGLPCWTHSSPAGKSTYARAGFEEVGSLSYNLDDWVPENLGSYTFYYMRRPA